MHASAAAVACALLAALAVFQFALALGAPLGRFAWGGRHERVLSPGLRVASALSILLYVLFVVVLLDRGGLVDALPDSVSRVSAWVLLAYFTLGVVMNGVSRSRDERIVMTPTVLVLAICTLFVALS